MRFIKEDKAYITSLSTLNVSGKKFGWFVILISLDKRGYGS